ncbi:hypothetical protein ABH15_07890 [Methanoculleus taiwanensis]|uniref:Flagellin n=1 Tax=Methanoculleus taiwanensis TaxID=1550565 RepID=A0A498H168_9EURY|nr:archaellin/type IV pilin N-terminal domain-containing protein [Methanoculleus taiwanensis]RXE56094.1 hypothetical protein ABH15_07890 [Methanoculleus taiwanensis]
MCDRDDGFTGLEAAIILIAFVVVASVFSYMVLGTGFIAIQNTQQVVHDEVQQASSSLKATGSIYGFSQDGVHVQRICIPVGLAAGGGAVDISTAAVRFLSRNHKRDLTQEVPLMHTIPPIGSSKWSVGETFNDDGDSMLEPGEEFQIYVAPLFVSDLVANGEFTVEIKPAGAGALRVERHLPAAIDPVTRIP